MFDYTDSAGGIGGQADIADTCCLALRTLKCDGSSNKEHNRGIFRNNRLCEPFWMPNGLYF